MSVISFLLLFGHIEDGESHCSDATIFQNHAGTLQLVPVVHRAIGVACEVLLKPGQRLRLSPPIRPAMAPMTNPSPSAHIHRGIRERKIMSRIETGIRAKVIEIG